MGVLFTLVLATSEDVSLMAQSGNAFEAFETIPTKLLDQVTLGQLFSILAGAPFDVNKWLEEVLYENIDYLWIYQIPDPMVRRLADLSQQEQPKCAQEWFQTEEIQWFFHPYSKRKSFVSLLWHPFASRLPQLLPNKLLEDQLKRSEENQKEIEELLGEICELAQKAVQNEKKIFLCCTL